MDRASTYQDPETLDLLATKFVPVGISLQEDFRSEDPSGEFFRKIVNQRPEPKHSKQGYYIVAPDGTLLRGWMYPRPDTDGTMKKYLREALASYQAPSQIEPLDGMKVDRAWKPALPGGGAIVATRSKLLDPVAWPDFVAKRFECIKTSMGHDRLWILKAEIDEMAKGGMPDSLLQRLIRFHLGDDTRCYLDMWSPAAMKRARVALTHESDGFILVASVELEEGAKGLDASLYGRIVIRDGVLATFDVVSRATAWGKQNGINFAPLGKFTVVNAFTLARPGVTFDALPIRAGVPEYLQTKDLQVTKVRQP